MVEGGNQVFDFRIKICIFAIIVDKNIMDSSNRDSMALYSTVHVRVYIN